VLLLAYLNTFFMNTESYYKQVVLKVPGIAGGNTATKLTWDDQPQLRYARVTHIEAYSNSDLNHAQPAAVPVLADADVPKLTLVFRTNDPDTTAKGEQVIQGRFTKNLDTIQYLPFSVLHRNQNSSANSFVRYTPNWKNRYIVWQDSYVAISPGGLANTTDIAIVLGVYYTYIDDKGNEIMQRN